MSNTPTDGKGDVKIVLTDPTLFGNDAAEDEKDEIFFSYAVDRPELEAFSDFKRQLCISRAYKGEGKSALLRLTRRNVNRYRPNPIIVAKTASEIAPEVARDDYASWIRAWKASILSMFANEIGSRIGVAWTDDAMSLVEEAEKSGFRKRSLLSAILGRLKLPELELGGAKLSIPEKKVLGTTNPGEAVRRWTRERTKLWLFVDDVDKNFENTKTHKMKVASFFDACRELINNIPELYIRTVVRPNVWTTIRLEYESLSHVEQYAHDLRWSEDQMRHLISRRIRGYLKRTRQWDDFRNRLRGPIEEIDKRTISTTFIENMPWGRAGRTRPPHVVLYTLSKRRPRWIIELAKVSANGAVRARRTRISIEDIVGELAAFGNRRIQDTVSEFSAQCPQIEELLMAFSREREQLTTAELLSIIDRRILPQLTPTIIGITGRPTNVNIAHFLFEIGLFYARKEYQDGTYEHITFSDRPSLLRARTAIDEGMVWEIHPVYRQALEIRDSSGRVRVTQHRKIKY